MCAGMCDYVKGKDKPSGMSRSKFNQELRSLQQRGIVAVEGRRIFLLKKNLLEAMVASMDELGTTLQSKA
mgnify:CR=1 FL=1